MKTFIARPVPAEPVENLGGGNTRDAHGVERYMGWNAQEAVSAACFVGTIYAWEWLQAWNDAELDPGDAGPDGEER